MEAGKLWSSIRFDHPPPYIKQLLMLKRSGSAPLNISFASRRVPSGKLGVKSTSTAIRALRPHVGRIRSFKVLYIKGKAAKLVCDEFHNFDMPLLQSVELETSFDPPNFKIQHFGNSTRIASLHISGSNRTRWQASLLRNLTTLTLGSRDSAYDWEISTIDMLAALSSTPMLRCFTVYAYTTVFGEYWSLPQVKLEHLTQLFLLPPSPPWADWIVHLLPSIVAPNLRHLPFPRSLPPSYLLPLNDAPIFPFPSLQSLEITNGTPPSEVLDTPSQYLSFISRMPNLKSVIIPRICTSDALFADLSTKFPQLVYMEIETSMTEFKKIVDLMTQRSLNPMLSNLISVKIGVCDGPGSVQGTRTILFASTVGNLDVRVEG